MRRLKKIFLLLFLSLLSFGVGSNVLALTSFPTTIESLKGNRLEFSSVSFWYKYTTSNQDVYCLEYNKYAPDGSCKLMEEQYPEAKAAGIASIIKSVPDGDQIKYYWASIAIHLYNGEDYVGLSSEDAAYVKNMVDSAKAVENGVNNFNITASTSSKVLTKSGDYYVSTPVNVVLTSGDGYSVSLNNPNAEVINKTANSFQIRIPVSAVTAGTTVNVTANITGNKSYDIVGRYDCGAEDIQKIVPDITITKSKQKSTSLAFNVTKTRFSITKVDINKKPLKGALLQIFDEKGNELKNEDGTVAHKWTSTSEAHYIDGLPAGTYILREIKAPDGYELLKKDIVFTVSGTGTVTVKDPITDAEAKDSGLILFNVEKTKVLISKQDATTAKELAGAVLQILDSNGNEIKDKDGNVLYRWVSTGEPYYIEGLPAGKYFLVETAAPSGYVLNSEKVEFVLKNDEKVINVIMKNTPIVEVPKTGFNAPLFMFFTGGIALIAGGAIIYLNVRKKEFE